MPRSHIICSRMPTVCKSQFLTSIIAVERMGHPPIDPTDVLANIVRRFHDTTIGVEVTI